MSEELPEWEVPAFPSKSTMQEFVRDLREVAASALEDGDLVSASREEGIADRVTRAIGQGWFPDV